ncbi:MAG TPA: flavodoxin family protein [Anaeromyxobacter sp.]|jgi:multimeric flavodoxin WrbA|nr:flavodoxin family protein [Anaeromyxobacter sp.]
MKSVIAFVGSARKQGVTYRATRQFLDDLESFGDVRSELVFLSEYDIGLCRGCKACFIQGEEFCPLHDDRDLLIEKMARSDGVVLASPVYSFQVSAHLKAFLDRLGFAFHRPRFHGKAYTSIAVEGLYGGRGVVKYLDFVGGALGFNVVKGSRIVCRKNPDTAHQPMLARELQQMEAALARQSRRFHEQLMSPPFPEPTTFQLFAFRMARTSIELQLADDRPDHAYYRERGWFESDYYYPTKLGLLKRAAGAAFDRMAARSSRATEHP